MKIRCRTLLIGLVSANLLIVLGGYFAMRRLVDVAAVQASLERNWEINFNAGGRPPLLPDWADTVLQGLIEKMVGPQREHFSGPKTNRDNVWRQRVWTLFRGPITQVEIWYPERMREDLGAALARLPSLKRLVIHDAAFSKEDWACLFVRLNSLVHLEELEIGGDALDDRTIEPLRGSKVRRLVIYDGELAEFSPATFAQMPRLKELTIATIAIATSDVDPSIPHTQKLIREAVPGVKVVFE